jgi:hypothetical protein
MRLAFGKTAEISKFFENLQKPLASNDRAGCTERLKLAEHGRDKLRNRRVNVHRLAR